MTIFGRPPTAAHTYVERRLDLTEHLPYTPENAFLVYVEGDALSDLGVLSGDLLIVERAQHGKHGDVVITANDGHLTVKQLNHNYLRIVGAEADNLQFPNKSAICGIARYSIRKL